MDMPMDEAIRKTLSPDYYMTSIESSYYSEDEDIQFSEKNNEMSEEEARAIRLNWDRFIVKVQRKKAVSKKKAKEYLSRLLDVFMAKVGTLRIPEKQTEKEKFYKEIENAKRELSELIVFLKSKECKASSRVKILTIDSFLSLFVQRLEQDENSQSEDKENSTAPMIFVSVDPGTNRPLYHLIKPAPPIKNLSLRGGGGKGQGYVKMAQVFRKNGIFDHLEHVAGSSAGGIAAVALAFGIEDLEQFCNEVQAGTSKKNSDAAIAAMPFLKNKFHGVGIKGPAAGMIPAIDRIMIQKVQKFLKCDAVRSFVSDGISSKEYKRLEVLRERALETDKEEDLITFSDLSLLKHIAVLIGGEDHSFKKEYSFLDLTLTGWSGTTKETIFFNTEFYPDMPIVYAVRITMALPGVFQHVRLKLKDGQIHELFDGGVGSNSPSEIFLDSLPTDASEEEKGARQKIQSETLTCIFDERGRGSSAESSHYSYKIPVTLRLGLRILGVVNSMEQMKQLRGGENEKLDSLGNTFIVFHGDLDTLDTNPSPKQKATADKMSELSAEVWCHTHKMEPVDLQFSSLKLLLQELTKKQRRQVDAASWHEVLRAELFTRRDVLSSVSTDLLIRKIVPEDLKMQLDDLETSASRKLTQDQKELLKKMNLRGLWEILTHRARRILCRELKKYFNLKDFGDANPSGQKSVTPGITGKKTDTTERAARDALPVSAL